MKDKLYAKALIEKADENEFIAVASTGSVDRHGEVVEVGGWDLKNYKNDPVILWGHDHNEPAIGKATRIWVDKTGAKPILKFKGVISEATTRAREVKQLMAEGILRAFSVGFRPLDVDGDTFQKQELLEISVVNVPANAEAQMLAYKSLKNAGFKDEEIEEVMPVSYIKKIGQLEEQMKVMKSQLDSAVKGLIHLKSPNGRDSRLVSERLAVVKAIARASDTLLSKPGMSRTQRERLHKAVKLASENLIVSHKEELNGKNQGTAR